MSSVGSTSHARSESVLSPLAYGATPGSVFGSLDNSPEALLVNETLRDVKESLANFERVFDSLGQQNSQMIQMGGEIETTQHLNRVREEMRDSDRKQDEQIEEIKVLLENALQREIVDHLRTLIEAGVLEQIDQAVKERVTAELPRVLPRSAQDEVKVYRKQLQEVQRALHNSESRRANSLLRTSRTNLTEELHTIYKADGTISQIFPKNLDALFSMDIETARQLLEEYGMWDPMKSREKNLNAFMQFCGVNYQLVVTSSGSRPLKVTTQSMIDTINRLV
ncbi:hypothetical protein PsYK624_135190 [Phanerochaete sordida]|uniref:Uncharacterized protein n=1 Tax=Phanerochaete sordida TaxID=48140 RepID=A0A9P3LJG7_9APHY|nr:hypothetical protein PsYK624_135190 [Phanerochaete sordida]